MARTVEHAQRRSGVLEEVVDLERSPRHAKVSEVLRPQYGGSGLLAVSGPCEKFRQIEQSSAPLEYASRSRQTMNIPAGSISCFDRVRPVFGEDLAQILRGAAHDEDRHSARQEIPQ